MSSLSPFFELTRSNPYFFVIKITRIENLGHLVELRVLNLAGNEIVSVSNVAGMKALAELNLRRNKICTVVSVSIP